MLTVVLNEEYCPCISSAKMRNNLPGTLTLSLSYYLTFPKKSVIKHQYTYISKEAYLKTKWLNAIFLYSSIFANLFWNLLAQLRIKISLACSSRSKIGAFSQRRYASVDSWWKTSEKGILVTSVSQKNLLTTILISNYVTP